MCLTFRGLFASHDSNLYPKRSRIAGYNATKLYHCPRLNLCTRLYPACNLCSHPQRCQMRDIENSRKTAKQGAEWVTVEQLKISRKNSRNTRKIAEQPKHPKNSCFDCFGYLPAVLRLSCQHFAQDPLGTFFGNFKFRLFSMSVHLAPL